MSKSTRTSASWTFLHWARASLSWVYRHVLNRDQTLRKQANETDPSHPILSFREHQRSDRRAVLYMQWYSGCPPNPHPPDGFVCEIEATYSAKRPFIARNACAAVVSLARTTSDLRFNCSSSRERKRREQRNANQSSTTRRRSKCIANGRNSPSKSMPVLRTLERMQLSS